jgi:stress response protein YsnF
MPTSRRRPPLAVYRHYGIDSSPGAITEAGAVAAGPRSGDSTEAGDDAMTRSEDEVHIGKRRRERGRARLKKDVVTDYVENKVPVRREEVRLDYEPAEHGEHAD